jgi:hypothetical protein
MGGGRRYKVDTARAEAGSRQAGSQASDVHGQPAAGPDAAWSPAGHLREPWVSADGLSDPCALSGRTTTSARSDGSCRRKVALVREQAGKITEARSGIGMLGALHPLADHQSALKERPRCLKVALVQ